MVFILFWKLEYIWNKYSFSQYYCIFKTR